MRTRSVLLTTLLFGLGLAAPAFGQSITIQGRVLKADGTPVTGNAVKFRVQLRAPDVNECVLFDETHILDLSSTNGLFSVNLNDGHGFVNAPTTYGLEAAISNRAAFSVNSSYCQAGTGVVTYTPAYGDNRRVLIQFWDPATMTGFEKIPELDLNPMAFAMEARTLGGYPATSVMRVDGGGVPAAAPSYTVGEAAELKLLANGTSTKYTPSSTTTGTQIPSLASDPVSPPAGSIWYNTTTGELHFQTAGGAQTVTTGGGTISGITLSGGLTGGGSAGAVSIGMPSGADGQVLRYGSGVWAGYNYGLPDLLSSTLGSAVASSACSAGQTMYYDTAAKELKCQSIGLSNSDVSGVLGVSHGGTGLSSGTVGALPYFSATNAISALAAGSNGQVLTMNGSGLPVWQSLPAAAFTGSGTVNRLAKFTGGTNVGNSILTDDGTNVGIGTTTPIARLDVAGSLRLADGGEACAAGVNVGMMKYSGGNLYFCNASGWQQLGLNGAGITSINGLTVGSQTFAVGSAGTSPAWSSVGSVHTLNLPAASASATGVLSSADWSSFNGKLGTTTNFAGDVTGTYNANVVTKLQGSAVANTAPTSGQFLKYTTAWTPANVGFGDLKTTGGTAALSSAVCNAGQSMYYDSVAGDLKCQSISLSNASISGILAIANGGTGTSSTSQNYVFAGPTSGSGAPAFRQLTSADLPASASYWQAATGGINFGGGKVGITTSSPNSTLQVAGSIASAYVTAVSAYTLADTDSVVGADATSSAFTVTLPSAVGIAGRQYVIKKKDSSGNAVTVATTASQTIDGATTYPLLTQYQTLTVTSDGANWMVMGGGGGSSSIPSGAVMSFDLATCPSGWTAFTAAQDRVVVGAGASYALDSTGGSAIGTTSSAGSHSHTGNTGSTAISVAQMPSHTHGVNDPGHAHSVYDPGHAHQQNDHPSYAEYGGGYADGYQYTNRLSVTGNWGYTTAGAGTGIGIYGAATGISIQANGSGAGHTHTISADGAHTHTVDVRNPYVALLMCKKL